MASDFAFPRQAIWQSSNSISAPDHDDFVERFGDALPKPVYLELSLGRMALYDIPAPSGRSSFPLILVHGLNTPALGLLSLTKAIQRLNSGAHIVLFDLWGHGLSDTPLVPHAPHIFHLQILSVLAYMRWQSAHIAGFSFGGTTAVSYCHSFPTTVSSVALLAPAGLLQVDSDLKFLLADQSGQWEDQAQQKLLDWLEGGPLIVPDDWQQRLQAGEAVAEALREWELHKHQGYKHSVLSMFRDGGVSGQEQRFEALARGVLKHVVVIAEKDDVCSDDGLRRLGFKDVKMVKDASHSFVRTKPAEIASILHEFWTTT